MAKYTLHPATIPAGELAMIIYSSVTDLTIPTYVTLDFGDLVERLDPIAGTYDVDTLDVDYVEDYSDAGHPEGFWMAAIGGTYLDLQITLDEGAGATHVFYGRLLKEKTELDEYVLSGSTYGRRGTMRFVSHLMTLRDVTTADLITGANAVFTTPTWNNTGNERIIQYREIISQLLASALGGQTADADDVTVLDDNLQDNTSHDGITYWYISEFSLNALAVKYPNAFDLISQLLKQFFLIPRYYYDVTNSRHKIQLFTRGTSFATQVTLVVPTESRLTIGSAIALKDVQIDDAYTPTTYYWDAEAETYTTTKPEGWNPEITLVQEYIHYVDDSGTGPWCFGIDYNSGTGVAVGYTWYRAWDYAGQVWTNINATTDDGDAWLIPAQFYGRKFRGEKRVYERTYNSLKADNGTTDSHSNIVCGARTQISDGVSARNFYAVEVKKNLARNELTVVWQEV
jgi:hypothetical protein